MWCTLVHVYLYALAAFWLHWACFVHRKESRARYVVPLFMYIGIRFSSVFGCIALLCAPAGVSFVAILSH